MDREGGRKRAWVEGLPNSPTGIRWTADGAGVSFTVGEQGRTSVYFAPIEGKLRRITNGAHMLAGLSLSRTGQAAAVRSSIKEPGHLVTFQMLKKETLLVRVPDEFNGFRRPTHQLLQQLYLLAWFEKYRKK
jgi:hypothetical protein